MKNIKKIAVIVLALVIVVCVFAGCDLKITQEQKLLGAWRDSTGTVGYEFLEDGACKITYADVTIPIINIKYDGTVNGTYTLSKDDSGNHHLDITYTILSKSVTRNYTYVIDGNAITLTDTSDGSSTVLMAYSGSATGSSASNQ